MVSLITDDFNRADTGISANGLGDDWDMIGATSHRIESNRANLQRGSGDDIGLSRHVDVLDSADHYAEVDYAGRGVGGVTSTVAGVCVRVTNSGASFSGVSFYYGWVRISGDSWVTGKVVDGSRTALASFDPSPSSYPHRTRIEAEGSTLRHIVDGTTVTTLTDTSIAGNTKVGVHGHPARNDEPLVDNFEAGILGAPPVGPFLRTTGGYLRTGSGILRHA